MMAIAGEHTGFIAGYGSFDCEHRCQITVRFCQSVVRMDQCCSVIQLGYSQGIGEDQHGPSAVGAVREGSKIDAFGAFSRNAQVEIEVLVQDVSVHEREGGENYPVLGLIQGLETNEQVESPNVEWGRFRIVDTDSAAWWGGVEVQPGSPCDPTLRRSLPAS